MAFGKAINQAESEARTTMTKEKIESLRESYRLWPQLLRRGITNEGEGVLIDMTYQPLPCGCGVTGNGTLQLPLTVKPCVEHMPEGDILDHHDQSVKPRARIELKIVRRLLRDLQAAGHKLVIDDGEEETPVTDETEALKLLFNLDEAHIMTEKSFVFLVFGNDGNEVICDYGMTLEPILAPINKWADSL